MSEKIIKWKRYDGIQMKSFQRGFEDRAEDNKKYQDLKEKISKYFKDRENIGMGVPMGMKCPAVRYKLSPYQWGLISRYMK